MIVRSALMGWRNRGVTISYKVEIKERSSKIQMTDNFFNFSI